MNKMTIAYPFSSSIDRGSMENETDADKYPSGYVWFTFDLR